MRLFLIHLPEDIEPETFRKLASLLPIAAQDRLEKFRLRESAIQSLVGKLAVTWYLRLEGLIPPGTTPSFGTSQKGKPVLVDPGLNPPVAFNTSHDGRYVLLGIQSGQDCEVGVDLMQYPDNPREVQEGISEQLTRHEQLILNLASLDDKGRLVSRLWTIKEGFVKATGDGIGFGLERIEVDMSPSGAVQWINVDGTEIGALGWKVSHGDLGRDHDEERYAWAAFLKDHAGQEIGDIEHVSWSLFLEQFP